MPKLDPPNQLTPQRPRVVAKPGSEGSTLIYFGYGSNLSTSRLRDPERAPSAVAVGRAQLRGHALKFHKRSNDGSSKADAWWTGNATDLVEGVVFRIDEADRACLDYAEGAGYGYEAVEVMVAAVPAGVQRALTYIAAADRLSAAPPYEWYRGYVLAGALEHQLPQPYIDKFITTVETKPDPGDHDQSQPCPARHRR